MYPRPCAHCCRGASCDRRSSHNTLSPLLFSMRVLIQNHCIWLALATLANINDRAHVADHRHEVDRPIPIPELLIQHLPQRQVMRQKPPKRTRSCQPTYPFVHLAQVVPALRAMDIHQRQLVSANALLAFSQITRQNACDKAHPAPEQGGNTKHFVRMVSAKQTTKRGVSP